MQCYIHGLMSLVSSYHWMNNLCSRSHALVPWAWLVWTSVFSSESFSGLNDISAHWPCLSVSYLPVSRNCGGLCLQIQILCLLIPDLCQNPQVDSIRWDWGWGGKVPFCASFLALPFEFKTVNRSLVAKFQVRICPEDNLRIQDCGHHF